VRCCSQRDCRLLNVESKSNAASFSGLSANLPACYKDIIEVHYSLLKLLNKNHETCSLTGVRLREPKLAHELHSAYKCKGNGFIKASD